MRNSDDSQEDISTSCKEHTDNDLSWSRYLFVSLCECRKNTHDDRGEEDYKERVDALPDLRWDRSCGDEVTRKD